MNLKFSLLTGNVLALSLLSTGVFSQNIKVNLTEVLSEKGQLMVAVYNKQDHWLSDKPTEIFAQKIISLEGQITNKTLQFTLELPEGEYALYLFQDKDNNGELKSNWIGIPKEPVGTSNNAKGTMGPPKYKDASFQVAAEDIVQNITLANMD
ncbi:DUF2141 domain-containing protein [Paraglaciecola hydrolytica]|uniref:DUF2141 domain-containing protein n=1 Tax=Paraglaciecola hydrolytica TaxID=1799789 RepID=A0A136A5E7_9ALTE|nr:DUF2141 domain-containing protein [Paraglaciecola hydrolytica]KXI30453.1 hypothetical protein AX660_10845 [Paraglaciecola hydrolytica]